MSEKKRQLFGIDLGIMRQSGLGTGIPLDTEKLDSPGGFAEGTHDAIDAFSELMQAVEVARTNPGNLTPDQIIALSMAGYRF